MSDKTTPLHLAIFIHKPAPSTEAMRAEIESLLPHARFKDFVRLRGADILAYEFDDRPAPRDLQRVDLLPWVSSSEGTAWTGPVASPPISTGRCPFAAMSESMSEEEQRAFLEEHRRQQQQDS